jgi:hypoxanthine phosphoribosyltransferase
MGSLSRDDFTAHWAQHDLGDVVVSAKEIADRVNELGREITNDYAGRPPLLVCVLKGAVNFVGDLMRVIELPVEIDFMAV